MHQDDRHSALQRNCNYSTKHHSCHKCHMKTSEIRRTKVQTLQRIPVRVRCIRQRHPINNTIINSAQVGVWTANGRGVAVLPGELTELRGLSGCGAWAALPALRSLPAHVTYAAYCRSQLQITIFKLASNRRVGLRAFVCNRYWVDDADSYVFWPSLSKRHRK